MNNLHISLTEFRNESRVLKQAASIATLPEVDRVFVAALGAPDLREVEKYGIAVEARRFRLTSRNLNKSLPAQAIKYLEFALRVLLFGRRKNIRIVNVHAIGLLPIGFLFKLAYRAKLVYDTHELETETHGLKGVRQKLARTVERAFIRRCDHVFVVSENIADWYAHRYGIERPTVIMNVPRRYTPPASDRLRNALRIRKDQLIVLCQGMLGQGRGIEALLAAFRARTDYRAVIVFMGYGDMVAEVEQASRESSRIFFHPAVATDILLDYTASADIGVSLIENSCLSYYFCLPNKLFEYAMAGLPVIVSNMKEMKETVERHRMGLVIDSNEPKAVNRAIDSLLETDLEILKLNSRRTAEANSWEIQERRMLAVYQNKLLGFIG